MIYPRRKSYRYDQVVIWKEMDEAKTGTEDLVPLLTRLGLTEKQMDAVKLKVLGFTEREIAEALGITQKALQDRLKYARSKLKSIRH